MDPWTYPRSSLCPPPLGEEEVAADLKTIYQAATAEQAEMNLTAFAAKWDESHPSIGQSWRRNWERITPFFAYPADIRKVIYTAELKFIIAAQFRPPPIEGRVVLSYGGELRSHILWVWILYSGIGLAGCNSSIARTPTRTC